MKLPIKPKPAMRNTNRIRIQWWSANCVRITHLPSEEEDFPADKPWLKEVFSFPESLTESNSRYEVDVHAGTVCILSSMRQVIFELTLPVRYFDTSRYDLRIKYKSDEFCYGWGEWFDSFARKSGSLKLVNHESPAITQGFQTYSTIPLFWNSRGYGFFLLDGSASSWEIRKKAGEIRVQASGGICDYLLFLSETPKEFLAEYTQLTGRPPLLPRWSFGLWLTSYPQESQNRVLEIAEQHREHQIPLDAIILDYHWEEKFHNFRWREALFPNSQQMLSKLSEMGVQVGLIFTPFQNSSNQPVKKALLNLLVSNVTPAISSADERALAEYNYAKSEGFLASDHTAWWFGNGGMIDFTNPKAQIWWNQLLSPLYQQGIAFFKNDDGEYLPPKNYSKLGVLPEEYHNLFGFFYGKAIYEGMKALDNRRPVIYSRCVWAGSQRFPGMFLGDQKPTFVDIRRTLRAALNLSMAGFTYWTADTFGLDGMTSLETHMRYAQWGLFSPIARYFLRPASIDNTRLPWSHSSRAEASFRRHVELRYRLIPYFTVLAYEAYETGIPMFRPMLMEFPEDRQFSTTDDQFMYGSHLLFAPVIEKGAETRKVRFPAGDWYSYWTDEHIAGPKEQEVSASLDYLPIFVRGGTILPLGPVFQSLTKEYSNKELEIHFWPPFDHTFRVIDDDGQSRAYQEGGFSVTSISITTTKSGLQILIAPIIGDYQGFPDLRNIKLIIHQMSDFQEIRIGIKILDTFAFNRMNRLLSIPIEVNPKKGAKITIML